MGSLVFFISFTWGLHLISAQVPLPISTFESKLCIKTKKFTSCNSTLAESFTPLSPSIVDNKPNTLVFLFPPGSPDVAEPLHECGGALSPGSAYNPSANTEIFIHGWLDGVCRTDWMRESKDQLFDRANAYNESYNVILIDWTWGSTAGYYTASENCKVVGKQVGFVIINIMRQTGIGPEKFHIIGHSFGAIAAGFAGRSIQGPTKIRRITALDPSVEPFIRQPPDQRVTYRDATLVDVIHTNAGESFPLTQGDPRQLGHADFYPNGGTIQISCYSYLVISFLKLDVLYALASLYPSLCYHLQAIAYYVISINPKGCEYVGVASDSYADFLNGISSNVCAVMGMDYEIYHNHDDVKWKYYLTTTITYPYYDDSYLSKFNCSYKTSCVSYLSFVS